MKPTSCFRGLGYYAPPKVVTNADLEKIVDTSDEWIRTRTGITQRYFVAEGQACSDLAYEASKKALDDAGIEAKNLTHILVATFSPDAYIPSCACVLQAKLGNETAVCMDVSAACSGFLFALETARGFAALNPEAVILVVASEVVSSRINFQDRTTCVLFGDAAGAAVLTSTQTNAPRLCTVDDVILCCDGRLGPLLTVIGGGSSATPKLGQPIGEDYFVQMQGREVFKHAVRSMESVTLNLMQKNNLTSNDIGLFIPHQANLRIIESLAKKLDFPEEKIYVNVNRYGNTSAASVPVALAEARDQGRIPKGAKVMLTAFGGGFTWGSALLQF